MNLTERAMLLLGMSGELCDTNYENTPGRLFENLSGYLFAFCGLFFP